MSKRFSKKMLSGMLIFTMLFSFLSNNINILANAGESKTQ